MATSKTKMRSLAKDKNQYFAIEIGTLANNQLCDHMPVEHSKNKPFDRFK
jgi:hypothetical protein